MLQIETLNTPGSAGLETQMQRRIWENVCHTHMFTHRQNKPSLSFKEVATESCMLIKPHTACGVLAPFFQTLPAAVTNHVLKDRHTLIKTPIHTHKHRMLELQQTKNLFA